jgi:signal transduction histidine kinase
MIPFTPAWFNALLPPETHRGLLRRLLIVWAVALVIGLSHLLNRDPQGSLADSMLYSYTISSSIWFFSDPVRIAIRKGLQIEAPGYWSFSWRMSAWMIASMFLGYALGSVLGDAFSGRSSWELILVSPQRFLGFLTTTLAISFGFIFFFYQREKTLSLQRQATEARLRLLETQLEPHMLFNTLANLRALIGVDPDKAVHMLDRLNDYLRATLRASRSGDAEQRPHTLQDEFDRLGDYLELMAIRMGPRLRHTLTLPPELAAHPIPALLLQPLVENAIRHGLEPHIDGGEIAVEARAEGRELLLTMNDTGAGCASEPGASGAGFGLAQVRERLTTAFGPSATGADRLQWRSAPAMGTRITLRLPLTPPPPRPPPAPPPG